MLDGAGGRGSRLNKQYFCYLLRRDPNAWEHVGAPSRRLKLFMIVIT